MKSSFKKRLQKIRSVVTFWIKDPTLKHLKAIRLHEIETVIKMLPHKGRVLEIGAGTGWQAQVLKNYGYDVNAIDVTSNNCMFPVTMYDGVNIPFEDNTFDIIFSSNTLEHIPHVYDFQKEIHRVLKTDGIVLHMLPSSSWRLWTNVTHFLKYWTIPTTHGVQAKNSLIEIYYFSRRWWIKLFTNTGWRIFSQDSNRLFYTGHLILDSRLNLNTRSKLSYILGSSCNIFIMSSDFKKI